MVRRRTADEERQYIDATQTFRFWASQEGRLTRDEFAEKCKAERAVDRLGRLQPYR